MASVCSNSRLPPARSAAQRANPCRARRRSRRRRKPCWWLRLPGPHAHQRNADHAAQLQVGDAFLRPGLVHAQRIEIHGEQIAPVFERAMDHPRGARAVRSSGSGRPSRLRATRVSSPPPVRSSRKPRSAPVIASAVSTTEFSTSSMEKSALQRARQVQDGAQLGEIGRPAGSRAPGFFGGADLLHQPLQLRAVQGEDELVGIGRRRIRCGRIAQRRARHPLAVDQGAVAAAAVFQEYSPFSNTIRACARETRLSRMMRWFSGWRPMWKGSG